MSAGMAEVIAAHRTEFKVPGGYRFQCICGERLTNHPAHVAEELTMAGYGNIPVALREAAGEMPIETLGGADKASTWLRTRAGLLDTAAANLAAALNDPEGHALVQAIHDRKAEA